MEGRNGIPGRSIFPCWIPAWVNTTSNSWKVDGLDDLISERMFSWNAAGRPLSFNVGCQNVKFHFCCFRFFGGETSWSTQCTQRWSNPIGMEKSHHESMIISFGLVNIKSICTKYESNVLQHVQLSSPKSLWSSLFWTKSPFSKTHCISNCPRALRLPIPEFPKVFTSSPAWASPMLALKSPPMIGIAPDCRQFARSRFNNSYTPSTSASGAHEVGK